MSLPRLPQLPGYHASASFEFDVAAGILSRVIPLFGVLAKKFIDLEDQDARLRRDAQKCYSDIANIGLAVYMSGGEWASGMDIKDVTKLLAALEARFPTKKRPFTSMFSTSKPREVSPARC